MKAMEASKVFEIEGNWFINSYHGELFCHLSLWIILMRKSVFIGICGNCSGVDIQQRILSK